MTDIQAALGISQMKRLKAFIERRRYLAKRYDTLFSSSKITPLHTASPELSSWHLYIILCPKPYRNALFQLLRDHKVLVNLHYIPIHLQPDYQSLGFNKGDFPNSEAYYDSAISLPLFPGLTEEQQDVIVSKINQFFESI